jgi:hypothetical protein
VVVVGEVGVLGIEATVSSLLAFVWLMHCQSLMGARYFFD